MLIDQWHTDVEAVPEAALVGQYICGDFDARPSTDFIEYLYKLSHQAEKWDMSGIISVFPDRISKKGEPTECYPIIRELASLKRGELYEFKKRFQLCVENVRAGKFTLLYRMASLRTGCGFILIPIVKETFPHRCTALQNFTLAHKYELRLVRCIGVSIAGDADGWLDVEWMYTEFAWGSDVDSKGNFERIIRSVN